MADAHVNFFGGSPLNRLSWLRSSPPFLNAIVLSPKTRWLLLQEGQPLLATDPSTRHRSLARLTTGDVRPLLGPEPFFAQGQHAGEFAPADDPSLEAGRLHGAPIVFLGLDEPQTTFANALPSSDFSGKGDAVDVAHKIEGTPYFSLDVSDVQKTELDEALQNSEVGKSGAQLAFADARAAMSSFDMFEAAVFAEARSLVDWQARNKFCAGCGSPVKPLWGGWKLVCSSLFPWSNGNGRKPCPTGTGLNNFAHPRSDAVVIMAPIDQTGTKILLGRNKKWPTRFYSAMAGFIEPGESLEDAVRRELWEEAGIAAWGVKYHSTQPWPFPANIMAGFYAVADSTQPLRTDLDNELEDAKWYTRDQVLDVIRYSEGILPTGTDLAKPLATPDAWTSSEEKATGVGTANPLAGDAVTTAEKAAAKAPDARSEVPFKLPPATAIAGVLIREWAHGRAGPDIRVQPVKGNL
ncbi:Probable NADH [Sparassis crispa]|uniref:NAD(+) diphosphatase n=1 Tax=Sparassis crispa TaxID=139825 RepID=A0A401GE59_9APHY|nr:Probable NADH [Sparassis crispa]GBE80466.1 Probable NADH [Sparassis crispa]